MDEYFGIYNHVFDEFENQGQGKAGETGAFKIDSEGFSYWCSYKEPAKLSMSLIEEIQGNAGFFDENMIYADFNKIQELRLTDFIHACMSRFQGQEKPMKFFLGQLLESCTDQEEKVKMAKTIFKILYMLHEKQMNLPALVAFVGGIVS